MYALRGKMDNPKMIELLESEIDFLINKAHNSEVSYWQILRVLLPRCVGLIMQADAEYWLNQK